MSNPTPDQLADILSGGNLLVSGTQTVFDAANNPSGVDKASQILNTYSLVSGLISGGTSNTFIKSLSSALGVNFGALGIVINGVQLTNAYNDYVQAMQGSNTIQQETALKNLGDKTAGMIAAIGGTLAAVPIPVLQQVGLGLWLGGTAAQQVLNGNVQNTLDILESQYKNNISNLVGGAKLEMTQYQVGSGSQGNGEFIGFSFTDQYGIYQGQYGLASGYAANQLNGGIKEFIMPTIYVTATVETFGDALYNEIMLHNELNAYTTIDQETFLISNDDFSNALNYVTSAENGSANGYGNTVDFAQNIANFAGISNSEFAGALSPGSLSSIYQNSVDYFSSYSFEYMIDTGNYSWDPVDFGVPAGSLSFGSGVWNETTAAAWWYLETAKVLGETDAATEYYIEYTGEQAGSGSPIAIDLNGDGIQTTRLLNSNTFFDLTGDGLKERTAWLSGDDGFIAVDINKNGSIDGVNELFGSQQREEGYKKLAVFDSNNDDVIDANDDLYDELLIWQDANGNGVSETGELMTLHDANVTSLSLAYEIVNKIQPSAFIGEESSSVVNGVTRQMGDIYFMFEKNQSGITTPTANIDPQTTRAIFPDLTSWSVSNALTTFHLDSSGREAIGGDLACEYGKNRNLGNCFMTPAQAVLGNADVGTASQTLQATSAFQDIAPRLG